MSVLPLLTSFFSKLRLGRGGQACSNWWISNPGHCTEFASATERDFLLVLNLERASHRSAAPDRVLAAFHGKPVPTVPEREVVSEV